MERAIGGKNVTEFRPCRMRSVPGSPILGDQKRIDYRARRRGQVARLPADKNMRRADRTLASDIPAPRSAAVRRLELA